MRHSLPKALPVDWLCSKQLPDQDGCYRSWVVLRNVGGHQPFAVHTASWNDDENKWQYGNGNYDQSESVAKARFWVRGC